MRKALAGFVALALLVAAPAAVHAQFQLGPTLAFHDDADFGIGATLGGQLPSLGEGIGLMADFILFFPDGDVDYFEINGNITYDFPIEDSTVLPFGLAGLNIARASASVSGFSASDTEVGLNLGGGIVFDAGNFRPSVGGRFEIGGGDGFVIFATLPFALGS